MSHAVRLELTHRNPASPVTPPRANRREPTPPTVHAVQNALALAKAEEHPLAPCIHLIAYTGLRRGEALGLTWDQVHLDEGYLWVVASLVKSRELGLILEPPKTHSGRRRVDLDSGTIDLLLRHREWQEGVRDVLREAYQDQRIVFANTRGMDEPGHANQGRPVFRAQSRRRRDDGTKLASLPRLSYAATWPERRRGE